MAVRIAPWIAATEPSPTLGIKAQADELRAKGGRKVFDFGVGEICSSLIPCPKAVLEEMERAMREGATHYVLAAGDEETRRHIAEDLCTNFGLVYDADCIAVCNGPKDAIYKLLVATLAGRLPGQRQRVVCFAPYYESFVAAPQLVTGSPAIVLPSGADGLPEPSRLASALRDESLDIGAVIICSPNNPTGQVYPRGLLEELAKVCREFPEVMVVSDETYRTIRYADSSEMVQYCSIAASLPEQTVVIGGMSKEMVGTGLRIGFVAGPQHIVRAVADVQGNVSSCANLPSAKAYGRVLGRDRDMAIRNGVTAELAKRRHVLLESFSENVPDAEWSNGYMPMGAYYFFPSLHRYIGRRAGDRVIEDDRALASYILERAGVVCIPGSAFGAPGHFRFAYACLAPNEIRQGIKALGSALAELQTQAKL